mmetsp:Transcript_25871/g.79875  ORF Transcript_25871/g.79875 Transcript_25871/m.79875 type:complete len:208 (-) Transcript_25871:96-719(-)
MLDAASASSPDASDEGSNMAATSAGRSKVHSDASRWRSPGSDCRGTPVARPTRQALTVPSALRPAATPARCARGRVRRTIGHGMPANVAASRRGLASSSGAVEVPAEVPSYLWGEGGEIAASPSREKPRQTASTSARTSSSADTPTDEFRGRPAAAGRWHDSAGTRASRPKSMPPPRRYASIGTSGGGIGALSDVEVPWTCSGAQWA